MDGRRIFDTRLRRGDNPLRIIGVVQTGATD